MIDRKIDDIATYVQEIRRDMEDYKSSQPLGGESFVNYAVSSADAYDFSQGVPASSTRAARVTFTHSIADKYNIVTMSVFFRIDSSSVMAAPVTPTPGGNYSIRVVPEASAHGVTSWVIDMTNLDASSHTFFVKLYFTGTVSGTFSVVAI